MALRDYFLKSRQKKNSASIAKERLQILVAHDRVSQHKGSYLPQLKEDILRVIRKYVPVDPSAVTVQLDKENDQEILELNIILPDRND